MKSAAESLTDMFDIRKPPTATLKLMTSLLFTLNKNDLIGQAIQDISKLTEFEPTDDNVKYIKSLTQIPEMVGLQDNPRALRLAIELLPYVLNTTDYSLAELELSILSGIFNRGSKGHNYSMMKKAIRSINTLDLGYKIVQKPRVTPFNHFHIIKYEDKKDLIRVLKDNKLISPSILDKVLV